MKIVHLKTRKQKLKAAAVLLPLAIILVLVCKSCSDTSPVKLDNTGYAAARDVLLTAHRGFSCEAPENSLSAIRLAGERKYDSTEFDIRLSKDGVWVLMHDGELDRTTNGTGRIESYTYNQLLQFSIDLDTEKYPNEKIPTLKQALIACNESGVVPMVEIKQEGTAFLEELVREIRSYCSFGEYFIISFDLQQIKELTRLQQTNPTLMFSGKRANLYLLAQEITDENLTFCNENKGVVLAFNGNEKKNSDSLIKDAVKYGIDTAAWTIDEPKRLEELYALGVRRFTTNSIYRFEQ